MSTSDYKCDVCNALPGEACDVTVPGMKTKNGLTHFARLNTYMQHNAKYTCCGRLLKDGHWKSCK